MRQLFAAFGGLLPTATLVFPWVVVFFVAAVLVRGRWLGSTIALRVSAVDAVLAYSSALVVYLVLAPQPVTSTSSVRLTPGTDLGVALGAAPGDVGPWLQLFGNLLLLLPLGALLPLRMTWFGGIGKVVLAGLVVTCAIEFAQLTVVGGRVVSADDVLLNTTGALIGGLCSRKWWEQFQSSARPPWVLWWRGLRAEPSGRHALRPERPGARSASPRPVAAVSR